MSDLQIGLMLSIPIGILINLITPPLLGFLDGRIRARGQRRKAEDEVFKQEVERLLKDPRAFYSVALHALLRATYLGAIFGALAASASLSALVGGEVSYSLSGAFALVGALLVMNVTRNAVQLATEVHTRRRDAASEGGR